LGGTAAALYMEARQLRTQLRGALWKGPPRCAVAGEGILSKLATETNYGAKDCFCGKKNGIFGQNVDTETISRAIVCFCGKAGKWCSTSGTTSAPKPAQNALHTGCSTRGSGKNQRKERKSGAVL